MDYDDLLVYALKLLRDHEDMRKFYQEQFQHVLVDEYQDTNKIQADFIDTIAAYHHQVMAVGDDAQSIYSWRGANFENVLTFPQRFPGTREVRIETNYRSTPEILTLANYAIAANTQPVSEEPARRPARGEILEARADLPAGREPAGQLHLPAHRGIAGGGHRPERDRGALPRPFSLDGIADGDDAPPDAVRVAERPPLLRAGACEGRRGVPQVRAQSQGRTRVQADRVADAGRGRAHRRTSSGRSSPEGADFAALEPPAKAAAPWKQWVETHKQISAPELRGRASEQIQAVIDAIYEDYMKTKFPNFQSRLEDLGQLRAFAQNFERTEEFLAQLALMTNVDGGPRRDGPLSGQPCVRLSTIHQAKGLEWKVVFVIMLCDGMFPAARSMETLEGEEEERRLFYVAVTRACDELYLTYPLMRATASFDERWQEPSRFVTNYPRGWSTSGRSRPRRPRGAERSIRLRRERELSRTGSRVGSGIALAARCHRIFPGEKRLLEPMPREEETASVSASKTAMRPKALWSSLKPKGTSSGETRTMMKTW